MNTRENQPKSQGARVKFSYKFLEVESVFIAASEIVNFEFLFNKTKNVKYVGAHTESIDLIV